MSDRHAHRRAQKYRERSCALQEEARAEFRDEARKRFMLDQAATFQRVADEMAPEPPPAEVSDPFGSHSFRPERKCPARDTGQSKF
jgi:hypothetical protein